MSTVLCTGFAVGPGAVDLPVPTAPLGAVVDQAAVGAVLELPMYRLLFLLLLLSLLVC